MNETTVDCGAPWFVEPQMQGGCSFSRHNNAAVVDVLLSGACVRREVAPHQRYRYAVSAKQINCKITNCCTTTER